MELVMDMASCILKESYTREPYWQNSASDMLVGLILTLFEYADENEIHFKSLRNLRTQAFIETDKDEVPYIKEYFFKYLEKSSFLFHLLAGTVEVCQHTRSCIISEFDQAMRPFFCQDNLMDLLSANELDMSKIGKTKMAVFLIIPDEHTLYNSLISVFVKQCYTVLIQEAQKQPRNTLPKRVNFLLDEFSTLPQISDFPAMITASRSRNIRFNLIIQSLKQLQERYGYHAETIKGNCENWIFLHSRELALLNEVIDLAGNKNYDEPLVSISMLQTLDKDKGEAFVFHKRLYPFVAKLLDIDGYPAKSFSKKKIKYPKNTEKINAVFDLERYCVLNFDDEKEQKIIFSSKVDDLTESDLENILTSDI
jgi:type IV secretion system protein VirD4